MSGYYAWRTREPSQHQQRDEALLHTIEGAYQAGRGVYGSPRVHAALRQQGLHARRPKRRARTTDSRHHRPVAPNLLQQDFSANAPNEK